MNNNLFENNTFEYDGDTYVFDLDAIFNYVLVSKDREVIEKEITDQYEMPDHSERPRQVAKFVKEVTTPMDRDLDNIKYDLVKTLILVLLNTEEVMAGVPIPFGSKLAFDTLLSMKLIKKINSK
jgi:hypothetical protein